MTSERRRLPAEVRRTLHDAAIAHVADAADAVSHSARTAHEAPTEFVHAREDLERRLMRLRLIENDMPLAAGDLDELAAYAVGTMRDDLRRLIEDPGVRFDQVAELAEAAHGLIELSRQRVAEAEAPREGPPRTQRRGGGIA